MPGSAPQRGCELSARRTEPRSSNGASGVRDVLFPEGTWWMRVFHAAGVRSDVPAAEG